LAGRNISPMFSQNANENKTNIFAKNSNSSDKFKNEVNNSYNNNNYKGY
jgi:hypothetical protein